MEVLFIPLIIIIVITLYHFAFNLILGLLKEVVFLLVKNKKKNRFYIHYDYIIPMIIAAIPIVLIIIVGISIILSSGISSLFNIEIIFFLILIAVEIKLFLDAYREYITVKVSIKQQ